MSPFVKMDAKQPCPKGTEITSKSRCEEAQKWTSYLGLNPKRSLQAQWILKWKGVPYQCSALVGEDDALHFSTDYKTNNRRFVRGEFVMICETGKTLFLYFLCLTFNMEIR